MRPREDELASEVVPELVRARLVNASVILDFVQPAAQPACVAVLKPGLKNTPYPCDAQVEQADFFARLFAKLHDVFASGVVQPNERGQ